ncbi:MAG: glycosyltransferase family 4 protein [Actinomycetota bacterium]|nr:glycosyltransferase family 4 protein [Actinomycetota bacterium]
MRVLHVTTTGWQPREGVARAVQALVPRLPGEHHLAAPGTGVGVDRPAGFAGVHGIGGGTCPGPTPALRAAVAHLRPDVIHVHGGEGVGAVAWGIAAATAVPVVAGVYGRLDRPRLRDLRDGDHRGVSMSVPRRLVAASTGIPLLRAGLRRRALAAVCTTDAELAARLAGTGPVHLALGAAEPSPNRAHWSASPTIVFAGRAEAARGLDELVTAHLRIRRVIPTARLRLALLPTPDAGRWAGLRLPGLDVSLGPLGDLDRVLASATVAALPFRVDATITPALVAAEAMAVGLPVVATDVRCLRALVTDGHNGRIVPRRDAAELAAAIVDLLDDRDRWHALADGAWRTIEQLWSWDRAARTVASVHRDAAGRSPSGVAHVGEEAA